MNPDPPKGGNTYDATQRAMRFLKGNPAPEENKEGENPPKDKGANAGPRERVYAGNLPYDFRRPMAYDQMATDRFGEELAPDAAIWNMYLDEAQEHDRELVEGRQRSLDTLLLFAALFSAILTAFLIESKDLLQQDPADAATELLLIIARSQQRVELGLPVPEGSTEIVDIPEFTPSLYARWINGIWFMSLALSLSAALIAMLGKEWLTTFHSSRPRSTRRLAFIRQARLKGLEDWGALHIIALLPTLLHSSLLLFSVGLVIYLWALDAALAGVLTGVIGVTLAFYVVTGILGAVYEFCPFVTEVSQYTQRAFKAIFRLPSRDQNGDYVMPSFQDLQALVWLSKQAGDPVVVDYAYQAIAGLHHSPYVVSDTMHPRPNLSSTTMIPDEATLFGQDITMNSLLLKVEERFDDLLTGTLETGSVEPPVCRYMNAIIALASYTERSSDSPLVHWLGILDRIDRVWGSSLPPKSLSGSNFAGVLIAEMDVLKMAMELLRPMIPASNFSLVEKGSLAEAESVNTSRSHLPQHEGRIELYRSNMDISKATSDTFSRLKSRLAEWLEVSLALLQSQTSGETNIDPYLVTGLLRATTDAARYLDRIHPVLRSQKLIAKAPESRDDSLDPLQILVNILSQPASTRSESIVQLTEVLKTYSSLAPMLLQPLKKKDGAYLRSAFAFQDLNSNPPSSRREVLAIIVRYMMISAGYLSDLLRQIPECRQIFGDALELVFTLAEEGGGYYEPRTAIGYHVGEFIRVLEFFAADEANLEFMTLLIANKICILPIYPLVEGSPDYGLYVPPSCLPPFIQAYPRSNLTPFSAQRFMEIIVNMLRSPNLSLSQLPPQTIPIPELQPSIEYLHQITRSPGIFSALLHAGLKNDDYAKVVAPGIAQIAIIAANMDPALDVDNVELEPPAVPGFLEAVAWTLSRLSADEESRDLYHRFVVAASALLIFACRDQGSKEMVAYNPSRTELLRELNENKDTYVGLISEKRWNRLINGLNLVEGSIEELDHEMSDMESAAEANDGIDEVNGEISHEAQDEVQNEVREEVQEGVRDEVQDEVKDDIARGSNEPVVGSVDSEKGAQKSKENMPHASSGSLVPGSGIPPD